MTEAKTTARAKKTEEAPPMNIFQRINAISQDAGALAPEAKGGVPFAFRGIDGTVAHLTPFLNKYGVIAAPKVIDKVISERELINPQTGTPNGKVVKTTDLTVEYTFYGPDGDSVTTTVAGLADDFADRSTAQAMSVAFRIALLQLFHLPTHSKEPEETGQAVLDYNGDAQGQGSSAPKAVRAAQARQGGAAPTATAGNLVQLQGQAKALGQKLGLDSNALNELGAKLRGDVTDWFNDAGVMTKLVAELKTQDAAK